MDFDPRKFDEFEVDTPEIKAMLHLGNNKDFDVLCEVTQRWLVWRAQRLASSPMGTDADNVALVALQGANGLFKRLQEFANGNEK